MLDSFEDFVSLAPIALFFQVLLLVRAPWLALIR